MLNDILNGTTSSRSGTTSSSRSSSTSKTYKLKDGTVISMSESEYNERMAAYNAAYGQAYGNNVAAPNMDEFMKGNGASEIAALNQRIVEKDYKSYKLKDGTVIKLPPDIYQSRMDAYNHAYGLAYSNNVPAPNQDEFLKGNGTAEFAVLQQRIVEKTAADAQKAAAEAAAKQQAAQQAAQVAASAPSPETEIAAQKAAAEAEKAEQKAQTAAEKVYTEPQKVAETAVQDEQKEQKAAATAPQVVLPDTVAPSSHTGTGNQPRTSANVSVAPSTESGSSLLIPGLILAVGVIGAIALTSKSKKRR